MGAVIKGAQGLCASPLFLKCLSSISRWPFRQPFPGYQPSCNVEIPLQYQRLTLQNAQPFQERTAATSLF